MKSYCVSFSLSFFLQHYVLETNSCHVKLEFIHVQCRMGFHCMRVHNVFARYSQWAFGFFTAGVCTSLPMSPGERGQRFLQSGCLGVEPLCRSACVCLDLMRNVRVLSKVTTAASRGVSRAPGLLKAQCRIRFSFSPVEWVRMGSLGFNLRFPDD